MKSVQTAEELREALGKADRSGTGSPYPDALRQAAVAYHRSRKSEGASVRVVAAELGVSEVTLSRWSQRQVGSESAFRAIEVVAEPIECARGMGGIVVYGPRGLRIEGLTVQDIVAMFEKLS